MATDAEVLLCDTSVASMLRLLAVRPAAVEHWPDSVVRRLRAAQLTISAVTLAEAEFGWIKANTPRTLVESERRRLRSFGLLPLDTEVARSWAKLKADLSARGRQVGDNDLWIAATAKVRSLPILTTDTDFLVLREEVDVVYLKRRRDSAEPPHADRA